MAIADAYAAMVDDRPYKRAMNHDAAVGELRRHAGTQFDPELVTLFCDLFAVTAPTPDPSILAFGTPPTDRHDRQIAERTASAHDHRRRAARTVPTSTKTMAFGGEATIELDHRPAADRTDVKRPANPEGRGRAAG